MASQRETNPMAFLDIFRVALAAAVLIGLAYFFDQQNGAPERAREAAVREAVLAVLISPSTASFAEIRLTPNGFIAEVDAQNGYGAIIRTSFVGDLEQLCENRASQRCWLAKVSGSIPA